MPESIEHNASIIGRIFEPYYKSLMVKIHIYHRKRSIYYNNRTIRQMTVLLECIDLFCRMHFKKQGCASAIYYVSITANLLGIEA